MTIFGRKIDGFARQIGKSLSYDNIRQFGNKIASGASNGLNIASKVGEFASNVLDKGATVANGLGFGQIGGMMTLGKNLVNLARGGVKGLEKPLEIAKSVGRAIDSNANTLGDAIRNGDTNKMIGAGREILNPLKQLAL